MNVQSAAERGHARLDLPSRHLKAQKIERLLGLDSPRSILEIGCGSGGIAQYLGSRGHDVQAVDVIDSRVVTEGYRFQILNGVELPFGDESFDVVISNHVIEHVDRQAEHLSEIRRVLRADGTGYLATPNRWRLLEPHYRLPLLSVLPERWRTPYLSAVRGGEYEIRPLGMRGLEAMFNAAGLRYRRLGPAAIRLPVPEFLQVAMPSLLYRLTRRP